MCTTGMPSRFRSWSTRRSDGEPRKLLVQANRNGFYYVLDRTNGKFLHGTPFIKQLNWAKGLTPEGRPIRVPGVIPTIQGTRTCPATAGATNWHSPAYNPDTGLFYVSRDGRLRHQLQIARYVSSRRRSVHGHRLRRGSRSAVADVRARARSDHRQAASGSTSRSARSAMAPDCSRPPAD